MNTLIISLFTDSQQMRFTARIMSTVAKVFSVAPICFEDHLVEAESDATKALPSLQIVGLGNKAIDEARE